MGSARVRSRARAIPAPKIREPHMTRPLFPSVIIAALAFVGHVRPRFMDDRLELTDAILIARAGKVVAKPSNSCGCRRDFECGCNAAAGPASSSPTARKRARPE
jgi:hypothetical protein